MGVLHFYAICSDFTMKGGGGQTFNKKSRVGVLSVDKIFRRRASFIVLWIDPHSQFSHLPVRNSDQTLKQNNVYL